MRSMIRQERPTGLSLRNDPFGFDSFLGRFFNTLDDDFFTPVNQWSPAMDLLDEKDHLLVNIEMPGIDPKQVDILLEGDILTIRGERKERTEKNEANYLAREHRYGSFTRTVRLPYAVDSDKVKASYENGVMSVRLPKTVEHLPRQIEVEVK